MDDLLYSTDGRLVIQYVNEKWIIVHEAKHGDIPVLGLPAQYLKIRIKKQGEGK